MGKDIASRSKTHFSHIDSKINAKDMWAECRQLTGRKQKANVVDGITAELLNHHYAAILTDTSCHRANKLAQPTSLKSSVNGACSTFSITSGRLPQVWISYRPGSCGSVPHCSTSH